MLELIIVKYLLNKEYYYKYRKYINYNNNIYKYLDSIHDSFGNATISFSDFKYYCLEKDSSLQDSLDIIEKEQLDDNIVEKIVESLVTKQWAHNVALKAIELSDGNGSLEEIQDVFNSLSFDFGDKEPEFVEDDIEAILRGVDRRQGGLRWRLKELDGSIGGLQQGDFIFLFARPEVGKTTFLASEISYFAGQTDKPVIWFNNEENKHKVRGRMIQGALGINQDQLVLQQETVIQRFRQNYNNFVLKDGGYLHKREIERIMKEYQPACIVFDQIDKIKGFKSEGIELYKSIYQWSRELAKEYCPVIGVCQASVSAENKKWLTGEDIANSKTEKLAEADVVIGIGKTFDEGYENIRYIHLLKNKLSGIHAKIICRIDPTIARYKDI